MAPSILSSPPENHVALADPHPTSDQALLSTLENSSYTFLQPPPSLHVASLVVAKRFLDPLATATSNAQLKRQNIVRRKRKRGEHDGLNHQKPLQLKEVYLEGFRIQQIWEQARRVIDASRREAERSLRRVQNEHEDSHIQQNTLTNSIQNGKSEKSRKASEDDSSEEPVGMHEVEGDDTESLADPEARMDNMAELSIGDGEEESDGVEHGAMGLEEDEYPFNEMEQGEEPGQLSDSDDESKEVFVPDKLGLNDGFFSIEDFNRQSEFLEHQDVRGEHDGAASDEEDVDWSINPLASNATAVGRSDSQNADEEESEDDEDGPTFDDTNLNGPDPSESGDNSKNGVQMEDVGIMNNTNDIKYADFFAPPPRKASKSSRRRALPKTQPPPSVSEPHQDREADIQRTISAVRRDIFEDDLTDEEVERNEKGDHRSSHEKRQAALTAEIRRLEAAAVAKRDWTLSGEARAADRPINSLLEEDLDFERTGKPIPVITQEVSEDIEVLIKRRIIAREFDEVVKRRPGNLVTGNADARRGRIELEDTKPQQGLAELYENEHLKTADPAGYVDKRDEKLKKKHAKIEQMWKDVSAKLDALSSWHYKPKPPSASINIVADVPTMCMEDARPSASGEIGAEQSMLAPQEIYKAGEARNKKEEVVTRGSGLPVGREEMTRDEKTRRRRREKERIRKAGGLPPGKNGKELGQKAKEKQGIVGDLKKGGVKVIGKKGEIRDVEGRAVTDKGGMGRGAGAYKL